jgi:hypothetical protein
MTRMLGRAAVAADQTAFGIRTANPRDALKIIATGRKPLADLLDTLEAVHAVGGGVLLIVLHAEVGEVAFDYSIEFVATTGNLPSGRNRLCNSWCAHIKAYGQNRLPTSQRVWIYRLQHNIAHPPAAFSELSLLRGRS